jgi:glycerol-3-phosphate dehydrogenase
VKPGEPYDLLIIGGGINGVGIARDAAGRGLKVLLAEAGDLGSGTSSASSKLVHGGLRYLEHYEFRLVGESLAEREIMLAIAPHLVWPLQFVLPHERHLRPAWMIRAGLFLYDHLGRHVTLPGSQSVSLAQEGYGAGLKPEFREGYTYFDCCVDDARLVVINARAAAQLGADILPRTPVVSARREKVEGGLWSVTLKDTGSREVRTRVLVNAAGPWAQSVLEGTIGLRSAGRLRLVKGSHVVVPRIHEGRHAYILQNPDRRVIFLLPFEREYTLIGTTDVPVSQSDHRDHGGDISKEELDYLCLAASRYTSRPIVPQDVLWSYSGVRALYDDGKSDPASITRDYHLELDEDGAPLLSVYGGKLTTYRKLAETVLARLSRWFPGTTRWTASEPLPGGDFGATDFDGLLTDYKRRCPQLKVQWLARLLRRHGVLTREVLAGARTEAALGENFGGGLYEAEVRYLIAHEWAREAADVLWRRTKCGVHMSPGQRQHFIAAMRKIA